MLKVPRGKLLLNMQSLYCRIPPSLPKRPVAISQGDSTLGKGE